MKVNLLSNDQRTKLDSQDDSIFYERPRFVHHLDFTFRKRLKQLYRELIPKQSVVLDLMSSWVSHLPEEITYNRVIGHGMNLEELASNPRLDEYWIQNLNTDLTLPYPNNTFDTILIVAGWQYLQEPESISNELLRVSNSDSIIIVSFTNRAFWQKTPMIWRESSDNDRLSYISSVLSNSGWIISKTINQRLKNKTFFPFPSMESDPFLSVVAHSPL